MCMGCGVSKFDHEEASPTFKRPTKRHSNVENDGTLVSDRLLHEYGRKSNNDRKNVSSLTSGKWEPDARDQVNEKNEGGNAYPGFDRKFKVTAEEEKRGGDGGGDYNSSEKDKNEEENESFSDRGDDIALPGSPSFREYCVYPREDFNEDEGMIGAKEEINKAQGSEAEARNRRRSPRRGFIKRPAGWMQRQK